MKKILMKKIKIFLKKKTTSTKRGSRQISKSFWRGKRKKRQYHHERDKTFLMKQKEKKVEYMKNCHLTNKKLFFNCFVDFRVLGQLNLFYGLVFEMWKSSEMLLWV